MKIELDKDETIEIVVKGTGITIPIKITQTSVVGKVRVPEYRNGYGHYEPHFGITFEAAKAMLRGHPLPSI